MTNAKKPAAKKVYMSPVATLLPYCHIQKPDMGNEEFPKPRGEYCIKCKIPADKAAGLTKFLTEQHDANYQNYLNVTMPKQKQEAQAKGKRFIEIKEGNLPFFEDAQGNMVFNFKMHASYTDKNTKEVKELSCRVYDAQGKRVFDVPNISTNSEGRVEFSLVPYQSAVAGCGIKLQISKFQLLKLVEWQPEDTMEAMGDYEGGFETDSFGGGASTQSFESDTETPSAQSEEEESYGYEF